MEFLHGPTCKEGDASNRSVTGNREIRKELVGPGVPRVFHGRNDGDIEFARGQQPVQLRWRARHELAGNIHDAPVDRTIDRVAIDVAYSADSHHARPAPTNCTSFSEAAGPADPSASGANIGSSGPNVRSVL